LIAPQKAPFTANPANHQRGRCAKIAKDFESTSMEKSNVLPSPLNFPLCTHLESPAPNPDGAFAPSGGVVETGFSKD
jgi:hypothetical protein